MFNSKTCHKKTNTNRVYNKKGPKNKKDTYSSLLGDHFKLKIKSGIKTFWRTIWKHVIEKVYATISETTKNKIIKKIHFGSTHFIWTHDIFHVLQHTVDHAVFLRVQALILHLSQAEVQLVHGMLEILKFPQSPVNLVLPAGGLSTEPLPVLLDLNGLLLNRLSQLTNLLLLDCLCWTLDSISQMTSNEMFYVMSF